MKKYVVLMKTKTDKIIFFEKARNEKELRTKLWERYDPEDDNIDCFEYSTLRNFIKYEGSFDVQVGIEVLKEEFKNYNSNTIIVRWKYRG